MIEYLKNIELFMKGSFFLCLFLLCSCASSPLDQTNNIERVNKIMNSSPIKKPIRRTTNESKMLIDKIEEKLVTSSVSYCQNKAKDCEWNIKQEINMSFNAYASLEDGKKEIVLFTGLVSGVHYEEELAFVLAHEMGHHLANHINESIFTTYAGMALGSVLGAAAGDPLSGAAYGAAIGRNTFSISQENEADKIALEILMEAGYDLKKAKMVLLRMSRMSSTYYSEWLSSHPSGPERILHFESNIYENSEF